MHHILAERGLLWDNVAEIWHLEHLGGRPTLLSADLQHDLDRLESRLAGVRKDMSEALPRIIVEGDPTALRQPIALAPLIILGRAQDRQYLLELVHLRRAREERPPEVGLSHDAADGEHV